MRRTEEKTTSGGTGLQRMERRILHSADPDFITIQVLAEAAHSPNKDYSFSTIKVVPTLGINQRNSNKVSIPSAKLAHEPTIKPGIDDKEIHRRTGFRTEGAMLFYVFAVCNADCAIVKDTVSTLTWYEEWVFYFERVWGKTNKRWVDASHAFAIQPPVLRKIFDAKLDLVLRCLESWPAFVSYEEDRKLCNPKWLEKFGHHRVVFWDDTNADLKYKPSTAHIQKATHSDYYGGNCLKGGVRLQLCGFIGVWELWTGGASDTLYLTRSGILEAQEEFQNKDLHNGEVVPFLNVLDRGYRCTSQAWRAGKQMTLQPHFTNATRDFSTKEKLSSGDTASSRSGNERAVSRVKTSGYIRDGVEKAHKFDRFNRVWCAYAFQVNFMFEPVL